MGAKCCGCYKGRVESAPNSVVTLADLEVQATDLNEMIVEETRDANDDAGPSKQNPPSPTSGPSEVVERLESQEEISNTQESPRNFGEGTSNTQESPRNFGEGTSNTRESPRNLGEGTSNTQESPRNLGEGTSNTQESPRNLGEDAYRASDILWSTGSFSDRIPDGFYSVIPDNRLKHFKSIPTLDELYALAEKDIKADVILIDFPEDKKLFRYTELITRTVKTPNSNPVAAVKKIAEVVVDICIQQTLQIQRTPRHSPESHDFPLLGHINDSCCARALLFKVLADTVGFGSKIVMGFPSDMKSSSSIDSYHHMSVVVVLNSVEMLVDLMRCPGHVIPLSSKGIHMAHFLGKYSCVSPLKPSSPMYSSEKSGNRQGNKKLKLCGVPPVLQSGLSISRSEPSIATEFPRHSHGKAIMEQHKARSRAPRAIREPLKLSRFSKERGAEDKSPRSPNDGIRSPDFQNNVSSFPLDLHVHVTGGKSKLDPRKAISLPSSPQNYQIQKTEREHSHQSPILQNKPLLPYEEWNIEFSELKLGNRIDNGFFGVVHRGIWNETDVAIKMLVKKNPTAEEMEDFCNEISILSRLRHPNVILFLGACTKPPQLLLVTELMEWGSLSSALHSITHKEKLSGWRMKIKMMLDICRGLVCIHRMGIVHRDLKSANCLLTSSWGVKICDFGLSIMTKDTAAKPTLSAGTPEWMAPELIRKEPFSEKCDIFSFGVIMWEICTLSRPWQGMPIGTVIRTVAKEGGRLEIPDGPVKNLIADCWLEPPERRPSSEDILSRLLALRQ